MSFKFDKESVLAAINEHSARGIFCAAVHNTSYIRNKMSDYQCMNQNFWQFSTHLLLYCSMWADRNHIEPKFTRSNVNIHHGHILQERVYASSICKLYRVWKSVTPIEDENFWPRLWCQTATMIKCACSVLSLFFPHHTHRRKDSI